ncbi:DNA methyltransferase [Microvirga sp. 17 mud 1-3]|uniref:DNA methyltransferase n=1 Tax=Microvirga sp. 17 mud 1-3 TaxID=2082949 RepID=UPI0013A5B203|nr:DNA methyltransferase [Microvirga sp. 17 mud 1-3]
MILKATAEKAGIDLATVRNLENNKGTVTSLISVLHGLDHRFATQSNDIGLGSWLRERRKSVRYSQQRLACETGLSKPTIGQIERGQGHIDSLSRVMAVLGLPFALRAAEAAVEALAPLEPQVHVHIGDCLNVLKSFPENTFSTCITSPPYFQQRDYGVSGQIGHEETPEEYISRLVEVFREIRRVLRKDGTLWLNLGDAMQRVGASGGLKRKNLLGLPWRIAWALQEDGWRLRQDIIINKKNPLPEPVRDRFVRSHEYMFLLCKSEKYVFDVAAVRERGATMRPGSPQRDTRETHGVVSGGNTGLNAAKERMRQELETNGFVTRNKRSVWTVSTGSQRHGHFATFPEEQVEPCILAGCPEGGTVIDPFGGSGTTGLVAKRLGRHAVLIEINPEYADIAQRRCAVSQVAPEDGTTP